MASTTVLSKNEYVLFSLVGRRKVGAFNHEATNCTELAVEKHIANNGNVFVSEDGGLSSQKHSASGTHVKR